jgi:hypothetical protein
VVRENSVSLLGWAYAASCFLLPLFLSAPNTRAFFESVPGKALIGVYLVGYISAACIGGGKLARGFAATIEHFGWLRRTLAAVAGGIGWGIVATIFFAPATLVSLSYGRPFDQWQGGALFGAAILLGGFALFGVRLWLVKLLNSPNKVFISYRRDDGAATAARIGDRLRSGIGQSRVFMDLDNLRPGQRWDQELENALAECTVLIAIIGHRWMHLLNQRMNSKEPDYVREEIAGALRLGLRVIPVLIEGAALPDRHNLPSDLRDLVMYQKFSIAHERFGRDMDELIASIRKKN